MPRVLRPVRSEKGNNAQPLSGTALIPSFGMRVQLEMTIEEYHMSLDTEILGFRDALPRRSGAGARK